MFDVIKSVKLKVYGKVQGVFYRKTAQQKAKELNLQGWVKNSPDNTVEMFIQGPESEVIKMIAWCRQGPKNAVVSKIDAEDSTTQNYSDFKIIR